MASDRWEVEQTEWSMEDPAPWHIDENGVLICFGMNEDTVRAIVHEHNSHAALVERVEANSRLLHCLLKKAQSAGEVDLIAPLMTEIGKTDATLALAREGGA